MSTTATTTLTGLSDIVKFNRGEITPTFIPPVSCLETPTSGSLDSSWYIGHFRSSSYDSACYPSSTAVSLWDLYYYSPAPACPESYTTASTFLSSYAGFESTIILSLGSDTSAYLCCPTGYKAQADDHACTSSFIGTTTITYFGPTEDALGNFSPTIPLTATMTFPATSPLFITGDGVPIWYQASDKALLTEKITSTSIFSTTTASLTSSPASLSISSTTTGSTSATQTGTIAPNPSGGLSSGAKGGVGAGIAVVIIAAIFAALFIFRRRKRTVHKYQVTSPEAPELQSTEVHPMPELHSMDLRELQDTAVNILHGRSELDG